MTKGFLEEVALQGHAETLWRGFSLGQRLQSRFAPGDKCSLGQRPPAACSRSGPGIQAPVPGWGSHSSSFLQILTECPGPPHPVTPRGRGGQGPGPHSTTASCRSALKKEISVNNTGKPRQPSLQLLTNP